MKTPLFALLFLACIPVFSQDDEILTAPRALFKVSPQNFAINTLKVGAEFFNKTRTKSYSAFLYGRFDSNNDTQTYYFGDDFYKGLGGEFQYRKYLNGFKSYQTKRGKDFLQGIYVAGYLTGGTYSNKGEFIQYSYNNNTGQQNSYMVSVDDQVVNWGTGFTIGVHRTLWRVLFIDAYIGGGIQWSDFNRKFNPSLPMSYSSYSGITSPGYQGIMPKFGVSLGVAL